MTVAKGVVGLTGQRTWSAEVELTARLSRIQPTSGDDARAAELAQSAVDWERVIHLSHHHRVTPLVCSNLVRLEGLAAPDPVRDRLRALRASATRSNLLKYAAWLHLLHGLEERGIPTVTVKGFHLALSLYGDPALRPVGDLDLVVREEDVQRALDVLGEAGWRPWPQWATALRRVGLRHVLRWKSEMGLVSEQGVVVDLHWRPRWGGVDVSASEIHGLAQTLRADGQDVRVPTDEACLAWLLLHGHGAGWARLRSLVDVLEMLDRFSSAQVQEAVRHLDRAGARLALTSAFWVAQGLWAWEGPVSGPLGVRGGAPSGRLQRSLRLSIEARHDWRRVYGFRRITHLARNATAAGISSRAELLWSVRPTHRDWASVPLPRFLRFGYYLVRPLRILWETVRPAAFSSKRG